MKKSFLLAAVVAVLIAAAVRLSFAADSPAPQSNPELKQAFGSGKKTVVFFLNPMGRPCKAQNEILQKLHTDRGQNFNIVYIDANKPADQKVFYDYGVRGLPSLVLVDSSGRIGRVFAPGIQNAETLAQALDSIK